MQGHRRCAESLAGREILSLPSERRKFASLTRTMVSRALAGEKVAVSRHKQTCTRKTMPHAAVEHKIPLRLVSRESVTRAGAVAARARPPRRWRPPVREHGEPLVHRAFGRLKRLLTLRHVGWWPSTDPASSPPLESPQLLHRGFFF